VKRAAIYARGLCPDEPIRFEVSGLQEVAQRSGFETVVYEDRGTGIRAKHPGLDSLMADARRGCFEVVLIDSFDRLARSTKHFLQLMGEFDELGIQFISSQEGVDTSIPMGRLFLKHIGFIKDLQAAQNRENIRVGIRRRKLDGLPLGRVPLAIDHQSLVRDRLNGMSLTKVAKKYGVSRASVVRFVRLAQESNAVPGNLSLAAQREVPAAACVA
jgi:DNA invertase Pin-like site-specific DNA recombinase